MKRAKDIVENIAISNLHKYPEKKYEDMLQLTLNMDHKAWINGSFWMSILRSKNARSLSILSQHCSSLCLSDIDLPPFLSALSYMLGTVHVSETKWIAEALKLGCWPLRIRQHTAVPGLHLLVAVVTAVFAVRTSTFGQQCLLKLLSQRKLWYDYLVVVK